MKTELTHNEKRIKIAEACGWKCDRHMLGARVGLKPRAKTYTKLPDYFNDLNACHEMAMTLNRESLDYSNYCSNLNQIIAIYNSKSETRPVQVCDATAAQRAEAFGKTLELW